MQLEKNRGMTLIEVVISVVVIGIIMGVVYQIFISSNYVFTKSQIDERLIRNAQMVVDWIVRDVRSAETVTVSANRIEIENLKDFETGDIETIFYYSGDAQHSDSKVLYRSINGVSNPITTEDVYISNFSVSELPSGSVASQGVSFDLELKAFNVKRSTYVTSSSGSERKFLLKNIVVYAKKILLDEK